MKLNILTQSVLTLIIAIGFLGTKMNATTKQLPNGKLNNPKDYKSYANHTDYFMENAGQLVYSDYSKATDVLYYGNNGNVTYLFKKDRITYLFKKYKQGNNPINGGLSYPI